MAKSKKRINAAGEKEVDIHMHDVRVARKGLKNEAEKLKKNIGKKITFALTQDLKVKRDMQAVDRKVKKKRA